MTQKIIQIGNSTGLIIPKTLLDSLGLKPGSEVRVEADKNTNSLIIQSKDAVLTSAPVSTHFLKVLTQVNKQYSSALLELADK